MKIKSLLLSYLLGLILFSPVVCLADEDDVDNDPIVVRLTTESPLAPLYLAPVFNDLAAYPYNYLRQLDQVLTFDLNHNGMTYTLKRTPASDRLASSNAFDSFGSAQDWRAQNVFYVVKTRVEGKSLYALIFNVNNQSIKSAEPIPLTGDLSQDRRQVHRLADTIHKALFGTDGIATTKILYTVKASTVAGDKKWVSEVWEADYDGANARQITKNNYYCVTPIYIPPKPGYTTGGFMYVSYQLGQPKIYVATLKDGTAQRLTTLRGNQLMPAISQQRNKVAFICDITGNPDLFIQDFSPEAGTVGKPQQIFSAKQATQGSPTFSPDGKKIAFVTDKDGSPKVYVIDIPPPGTSLKDIRATLISKRNRESSAPCWSPDGTKLAYCAKSQGERQIWVYDFQKNEERQLTQGAGNKENPSWAPNSLHLVFNSSDSNASELYLINLNQADVTQITSGGGEKRFPSWEPRIKNPG